MTRLLILGELEGYATSAAQIAHCQGVKVAHVLTQEEALFGLRSGKGADLIFMDVKQDLAFFIKQLKQERFSIPVVACGIDRTPEEAAEAIKNGAIEYVNLPPDAEFISAIIQSISLQNNFFIYKDPKMVSIVQLLDKISASDAHILITGESGTGKEIIANYIHKKSKRANEPFVAINCAAIPDNLLESELFGHEKGAFTGAIARRIGKFEEASSGTLFLDEISEMHPRLQAKLLRAIQEKVIDRVGGTHPIKINLRLLASSNRNLEESVQKNEFRQDLYFRINVVNVALPSLRDRPQDVEVLSDYFQDKYAKLNQVPIKPLSLKARKALLSYGWPGNVRELENRIHRAVLLSATDTIEEEDLFDLLVQKSAQFRTDLSDVDSPIALSSFIGRSLPEVERELILGTLKHCLGNRTQTAQLLCISIRTLRNKLKEYSDLGYEIVPSSHVLAR